jgi:hypothetical protein
MKRKKLLLIPAFSIIIGIGILFLVVPKTGYSQGIGATDTGDDPCTISDADFNATDRQDQPIEVQIAVPGVTKDIPQTDADGNVVRNRHYIKNMSCYIAGFYRYFASVAGILATVMIMYGGLKYVVSLGNPQRIADAKDTITSAVIGLVITLGSYLILYFINPNLVTLKIEGIEKIIYVDPTWCNVDAIPDAGPTGTKNCGELGHYADNKDKKCVFQTCASGTLCFAENPILTSPGASFKCMDPKLGCENANKIEDLNIRRNTCDKFSYRNASDDSGICYWLDSSQIGGPSISFTDLLSFNPIWIGNKLFVGTGYKFIMKKITGADQCHWQYIVACPTDYQRVTCGECEAAGVCQEQKQYNIICDQNIPVTSDIVMGTERDDGKDVSICCKQINPQNTLYICPSSVGSREN